MPEAARGDSVDTVDTVHVSVGDAAGGDGSVCDAAPQDVTTDVCSDKVFAEGTGIVREEDAVIAHTIPPACATHAPGLATFSSKVTIQGKGAGRKDDTYGCGAKITTGSTKVNIGG